MQAAVKADPSALAYGVARNDNNLYKVVNHAYRVLNVNDYGVQREIQDTARMLLDEDPTNPVCKLVGTTFAFTPGLEDISSSSTVQYVDPFGFVRQMKVNVSDPLRHLSVK
jgi:hypothetical protein